MQNYSNTERLNTKVIAHRPFVGGEISSAVLFAAVFRTDDTARARYQIPDLAVISTQRVISTFDL